MTKRSIHSVSVLALVITSPAIARGDDEVEAIREVQPPEPALRRIDLALHAEVRLARGASGDPISLAPDAWVQLDKLRFGIVHSSLGITGFHGVRVGSSVCIHGDACDIAKPSVYHGGGVQAEVRAIEGENFEVFVGGGPVITAFDPFRAGLKLGGKLTGMIGESWVTYELEPNALVALRARDTTPDRLNLPVRLSLGTLIGVETGLTAPLDGFGDAWQVPLGVFGRYPITDHLLATAAFTFPAVAAGNEILVTGADDRVLTVGVEYIGTNRD